MGDNKIIAKKIILSVSVEILESSHTSNLKINLKVLENKSQAHQRGVESWK